MNATSPATTYTLKVGNLTRELPLVRPTPTRALPLVEFLGDTELTQAAAEEVRALIPAETDVLFTCETSSIPLVHALSVVTGIPYEVARKRRRPYMVDPLIQDVASMTLGVGETLWFDTRHAVNLRGKRVTIVLDVVSSGGTVSALERIVTRAGGTPHGRVAAFSQGEPKLEIRVMQALPVFERGA
jgi:adenine phosphoribosyltransferase